MNTALTLLPDFALILLGYGLRRWMKLGDHFWTGLEKLVYFVLFPALLFNAITKTPLTFASVPLMATGAAAMAGAMLLALLARPLFPITSISFASQFQCAFRFNSYIGLTGVHFDVAMAFAALPTASSAYILTQRMGGDGARVARPISASTLLGMVSLPLWLAFLAG